MVQTMIDFLRNHLSSEWIVFIISLLPVLELRGGLVAASLLNVPWYTAAPIAIIGNILPIPFIIFFIEKTLDFLSVHGPIKKLASKMVEKGRSGGEKLKEKYPNRLYIGLLLFVAVPLPGSGAWTGALIAALLGLSPKKTLPVIFVGVVLSAMIMLVLAYLIPGFFQS